MKPSEHSIPDASELPIWHKSSYSDESGGNCLEASSPAAYARWRKSSYSGGTSGDCLEVTSPTAYATWRKSTYSSGSQEACLGVNDAACHAHAHVPVRDSKNPQGPAIVFGAHAWTAFITSTRTTPSPLGG